jgi:hypothetical protein
LRQAFFHFFAPSLGLMKTSFRLRIIIKYRWSFPARKEFNQKQYSTAGKLMITYNKLYILYICCARFRKTSDSESGARFRIQKTFPCS